MEEVRYYRATPEEKKAIIEKLKKVLLEEEKVLLAIVYGGFSRRDFFRDIDIAVYTGGLVEDPLRFETALGLKLSQQVRIPVDVRVVDEAPAWFKLKVSREGTVVYERMPGARSQLLKEAVGEHQDLQLKYREVLSRKTVGHSNRL